MVMIAGEPGIGKTRLAEKAEVNAPLACVCQYQRHNLGCQ
jgi:hypothetical protein